MSDFGPALGIHKSPVTLLPGLNLPQRNQSLPGSQGGAVLPARAPHHRQDQFFAKRTPHPQPGFPPSRPRPPTPQPHPLVTCNRTLQTWRWTVSNLSSSRVPAVSPLDDAFLGGNGILSFLCWIEKNWVTIPVSSPAPSEEGRHPPFLESSDQGGSLQAPGRKSSTQEKSREKQQMPATTQNRRWRGVGPGDRASRGHFPRWAT